MQYHAFFLTFAVAATLLYTACSCPPDEEIGQIGLSEPARSFLPYDGTERLVFTDEDGNTIAFEAPRGEEKGSDQVCIRTICTEARFNSPSSCEYFQADNLRYVFVSEDRERLLDLLVYTLLYQRDTERFYDALQVSYAAGSPSFMADWMIEKRFDDEPLDLANTPLNNLMTQQASLTLNGETFDNVLRFKQNDLGIYIQAGKGVVALEEAGRVWLLQE